MQTDASREEAYKQFFDVIRPRSEYPLWMILAFAGFIVLIVVLLWRGRVVLRRREEQFIRRIFQNLAQEKGLDEEDERLLWRMAREVRLLDPLLVFSSISAFEGAEGRELSRLSEGDDAGREELTDRLQTLKRKLRLDRLPLGWALRHTRDIPVGQRIRVGFKRDETTRFCSCTVVEVDASGMTVAPIVKADRDALKEVTPEETLYVRFWRRDDTEYKFRTRILPEDEQEDEMLLLAHAEDLERVQRRDFFRLPVHIPVALYAIPDVETASLSPGELRVKGLVTIRLKGMLTNLSAGGIALRSKTAVEEGALLMVDPEVRTPFSLEGIACRTIRSEQEPGKGYVHHFDFINVNETLRDRLVGQIDREQIRMARRERQ